MSQIEPTADARATKIDAPTTLTVPGPRGQTGRERTPAGEPALPARRAVALVLVTLAGLVLVDAHGLRRTAENMDPGWPRSTLLAIARPADAMSRTTHLDTPRRLLYQVFGHDDGSGGTSELLAPTNLPMPAAAPAPFPPAAGAGGAGAGGAGAGGAGGAVGAAGRETGRGPGRTARAAPALPPLRTVTAADPLKLLVTGDSMSAPLAPALSAAGHGTIHVDVQTKYSTGLVRPDFFDWAANARKQIASVHPEAVVLTLGGNDGQGFTMPGGVIYPAGSPQWEQEYSRRATILLLIFSQGGRVPVYWMSLPVARNGQMDADFRGLNTAVQAAVARVPRAHYIDIRDRLSRDGAYGAYIRDDGGSMVLAREGDGVHMTEDGTRIIAPIFLRVIDAEWNIRN